MASIASNMAGDSVQAARLLGEAANVTSPLEDVQAKISLLQARSMHGFFSGDIESVRGAAIEGIRLAREANDTYSLEMMLLNLGGMALMSGDPDQAKRLYSESLRIARRIDDRVAQYALLDSLACQAAISGQPRLAAQLIGAGETVMTQAGASLIPILAPLIAQAETIAVGAIGRPKYDAAVAEGKRLSRDDAIKLALGEAAHPPAAAESDGKPALLGKREADVARLIAEGHSNKQIGSRLFISERTVDSHVRSILNKLGFNSRAQIAAWMSSRQ
jgi:DNA-binding CsgD family transcriptional regulator